MWILDGAHFFARAEAHLIETAPGKRLRYDSSLSTNRPHNDDLHLPMGNSLWLKSADDERDDGSPASPRDFNTLLGCFCQTFRSPCQGFRINHEEASGKGRYLDATSTRFQGPFATRSVFARRVTPSTSGSREHLHKIRR